MKVINYPAMASPPAIEHIGNLIDEFCEDKSTILDPFCGTGRLLVQPREKGHNVIGIDCSPIALLSARVLHQKSNNKNLVESLNKITAITKSTKSKVIPGDTELFWFEKSSYIELVSLLFTIEEFDFSKNTKRIFWIIMVDTIRKVSYLREEEYKLHRMSLDKRNLWKPNTIKIFKESALSLFNKLKSPLKENLSGKYRLFLGDIASKTTDLPQIDTIITSPPYGDSRSTVGYGQFARIPLMILQLSNEFREEYPINYSHNLDTVCLGGTNCFNKKSLEIPKNVRNINGAEMKRFIEDYFGRLSLFDEILSKNGIICFILADRVYKGKKVPLIKATSAFFKTLGYQPILEIDRMLTWKRLPRSMKHAYKKTTQRHEAMNYETVLGFKKIL